MGCVSGKPKIALFRLFLLTLEDLTANSIIKIQVDDKISLPSSADGNYEVRYKSNVLIYPDGEVLWVPPAIYQVRGGI